MKILNTQRYLDNREKLNLSPEESVFVDVKIAEMATFPRGDFLYLSNAKVLAENLYRVQVENTYCLELIVKVKNGKVAIGDIRRNKVKAFSKRIFFPKTGILTAYAPAFGGFKIEDDHIAEQPVKVDRIGSEEEFEEMMNRIDEVIYSRLKETGFAKGGLFTGDDKT